MDIRQLEIFQKIVDEKSFSRAAKSLGLTQPTASGHIKSLEKELGVRLFDRLGREVEPTQAGWIL
ncbi:MAG: LysR family transcriptional regulator, partial [bacterium]|nr:LysR family transcriptional regulator [bacterium]